MKSCFAVQPAVNTFTATISDLMYVGLQGGDLNEYSEVLIVKDLAFLSKFLIYHILSLVFPFIFIAIYFNLFLFFK